MTSKEYIEGVLYNLEEALKLARETNNKDLELDCEMQIESYKQVLKDLEVLDILKPKIKLKESSLKNIHYNVDEKGNIVMEQDLKETPVVFIQSSGFVFENSAEHKTLKRWLGNEK